MSKPFIIYSLCTNIVFKILFKFNLKRGCRKKEIQNELAISKSLLYTHKAFDVWHDRVSQKVLKNTLFWTWHMERI